MAARYVNEHFYFLMCPYVYADIYSSLSWKVGP